MTRLDEALERLERAVVRLETVCAAAGGTDKERVRAAVGDIAARVDGALAQLDAALEGEAPNGET